MKTRDLTLFTLIILLILSGCQKPEKDKDVLQVNPDANFDKEKAAILATLNNETKDAFQRNYDAWTENWLHDPGITKTYLDFTDNTFSESVGWNEISQFVKMFIEEHPKPEPLPKLLDKIDVRLYGNGAWVTYAQQDSLRGLKRETRLMEKVNGKWKIAGMQTTIYGFKSKQE